MSRLLYIRRHIFGVTQVEMAAIAGVRQSQVSRWENGHRRPSIVELERIRTEAVKRQLAWDDRWFFENPAVAA